jgi:hypothetical protein
MFSFFVELLLYLKSHFISPYPFLKGQSHEKVDELRVWGVSLRPN